MKPNTLADVVQRMAVEYRLTATGCREWTGGCDGKGRGAVKMGGMQCQVHRIAAHLHLGLDLHDRKTLVLHTCDNPPCFNEKHLYLGTYSNNRNDLMDRHHPRNRHAVLTEEQVCIIRYELIPAGFSNERIANLFDLRKSAVSKIRTGRNWSYL